MRLIDPLQTSLNGRPFLDYALLDYGIVTSNSRYVQANPFGAGAVVLCVCEVQTAEGWMESKWRDVYASGSSYFGALASATTEGIVVRTGWQGVIAGGGELTGSAFTTSTTLTSASCRVHVWRVGA